MSWLVFLHLSIYITEKLPNRKKLSSFCQTLQKLTTLSTLHKEHIPPLHHTLHKNLPEGDLVKLGTCRASVGSLIKKVVKDKIFLECNSSGGLFLYKNAVLKLSDLSARWLDSNPDLWCQNWPLYQLSKNKWIVDALPGKQRLTVTN